MITFFYNLFKFLFYLFDTNKNTDVILNFDIIKTDFLKIIIYHFKIVLSFILFLHFLTLNKLLWVIYLSVGGPPRPLCYVFSYVYRILLTYIYLIYFLISSLFFSCLFYF